MTNSTFYSDGYRAGYLRESPSPPGGYYRNDGSHTDVFAAEYMDGYRAGKKARDAEDRD